MMEIQMFDMRGLNSVQRKIALAWLFGRHDGNGMLSSKSLTDAEVYALSQWVESAKIDEEWVVNTFFSFEWIDVVKQALRDYLGGEFGFDDRETTEAVTELVGEA